MSATVHQNSDTAAAVLGNELKDKDDMLRCIDLGGEGLGGSKKRVWMLDPLDGTEAFMTGGQYTVCLALLEDGEQKVGVIGCPNLPFNVGRVNDSILDADN